MFSIRFTYTSAGFYPSPPYGKKRPSAEGKDLRKGFSYASAIMPASRRLVRSALRVVAMSVVDAEAGSGRLATATPGVTVPAGPSGPTGPSGPCSPCGPVGPCGIVKLSVTAPVVPSCVTEACVPGSPVVVVPTVIVAASPAGPVSPAGPCSPVGPISPCGPVSPVGPVGPISPCGPVSPVGPVGPVGPVAPVALAEPAGPVAPVAPVGPVGPVALVPYGTVFILFFLNSSKLSSARNL